MDSPVVTQLFRQLFSHRASHCLRRTAIPTRRGLATKRTSGETKWQQRTDAFPEEREAEFNKYPTVTAEQLRGRRERPRRVKMLLRDFIEDSLYNPHYGYFSKQVVIFHPGEAFDFWALRDEPEFHRLLGERYEAFEDELDKTAFNDSRQLWHTPTELFRPYYGQAIARCLVDNYKLAQYPYHDLLIYEMGAGNGTLMLNILDFIRDAYPEVYERTKFRVIEISTSLASLQTHHLKRSASARGHLDRVEIINRSVFDWDQYVSSPCFFLALEVFDNFAHDAVRYDPVSEDALQANVLIDAHGDFFEFYSRDLDPVAARFLRVRDAACEQPFNHPLRGPRLLRNLRASLPFAQNLSTPEYIPTRLMQFFDVLHTFFPAHKLVTSDFHSLPDTIQGVNAPVVQTRYKRRTVPVSTPLVQQGYFDILFPTDFCVMEDVYRAITGKLTRVMTHEDFLRRWAFVEDTEVRSGENPMLSWYRNASVMTTV
ncbi:uncharacterized protein K452DRAFT_304799 [Aplosporella prunicola CBS 121167]|uniref:Protein arginine methyltransferase NDUFAF7 n=1 Tax=Aplosporella prunicola CBS 121167 TaxID=1176127 RepID=A0A6A6BSW8_9PEZI|nr:uncharacterized protein K452DRAFT_304799 [Aplosporella prunicola CBS 121167]KAF2146888.1 hypothetical protein K452DRAFT_304799 [Aplosporella prunicola CBS 121167]